jgi:hypothetical protein
MRPERKPGFWRVILTQDRGYRWETFWSMTRGVWYRARHRVGNRLMDARALALGACNVSTWDTAMDEYGGGYNHWRCGKRRGHSDAEAELPGGRWNGAHRFNNYIWEGPGHRVEYAPLPIRNDDNTDWFDSRTVIPFRKLADGRHPIESRRRSRLLARSRHPIESRRRSRLLARSRRPIPFEVSVDD